MKGGCAFLLLRRWWLHTVTLASIHSHKHGFSDIENMVSARGLDRLREGGGLCRYGYGYILVPGIDKLLYVADSKVKFAILCQRRWILVMGRGLLPGPT